MACMELHCNTKNAKQANRRVASSVTTKQLGSTEVSWSGSYHRRTEELRIAVRVLDFSLPRGQPYLWFYGTVRLICFLIFSFNLVSVCVLIESSAS
jgi:hypothetical protein